jgi:hypothetical protein
MSAKQHWFAVALHSAALLPGLILILLLAACDRPPGPALQACRGILGPDPPHLLSNMQTRIAFNQMMRRCIKERTAYAQQ